ncbi:hypothetical protein AHX85_002768 [Salmonella enterica subsp. enterica]|nr:hypothetical protein [Salmonella enterica subsp. enterica]
MGKIAAIFRIQHAWLNAALTQEDLTMTLSPYLQEVAKRRTFAIIFPPIKHPPLNKFETFLIL